ncbi:MAG: hypothetical protein M3501_04265 [Actinomycetota bacterium]|nr:hypothetical protein [Actinomycetota bacterium]
MSTRDAATARSMWRWMESIHAVTYFSPEPVGALADAGYRGFWMGYFAGRAAPLGAAGPDVVAALFYNFAPGRVAKALPDAWGFAAPEVALERRLTGSVAALTRAFEVGAEHDVSADVDVAAELAGRVARSASPDGRALFAANAALAWPDDPLAVLWHATTLLREQRGDGHVATLVANGITGRQANVFQAAACNTSRDVMFVARDYDDDEWAATVATLTERGLVKGNNQPTDEGTALHAEIERRTDELAMAAFECLDDAELERLGAALRPLASAVGATGDLPAITPMGRITET